MFDWGILLRQAVVELRLSPSQFWALSLREWLWLNSHAQTALPRPNLEALMRQFPDEAL
jgi:uncharacterized phage protein (TIGR02216 family)